MFWRSKRRSLDREPSIAGKWVIDPSDSGALAAFGNVAMEFRNGQLWYEVRSAEKSQVILMTYRVSGNMLITEQPSHPRQERTEFEISGNTLTLAFNGMKGRFIRA